MKQKPNKPRPDFPLYAHKNRKWAKKIRGKTHYFGSWDDPDGALEEYLDQKDDLQAGRTPRRSDSITVLEVCSKFNAHKRELVDNGELSIKTWRSYRNTIELIVPVLGPRTPADALTPEDFQRLRSALAAGRNVTSLGNFVRWTRSIFKFAYDMRLISVPVNFGPAFKEPSKRAKRLDRQSKPKRMFTAQQILDLLHESSGQDTAMILLGINCGFGNTDCSALPARLPIDMDLISFPRPKTAANRLAWLWPETLAVIESLGPAHDETFFRTRRGMPLVRNSSSGATVDRVSMRFVKLMNRVGIEQRWLNFYGLRHTFETIASDAHDQQATDFIMGHIDNSMAAVYREELSAQRIRHVCGHVRNWLFGLSNRTESKTGNNF